MVFQTNLEWCKYIIKLCLYIIIVCISWWFAYHDNLFISELRVHFCSCRSSVKLVKVPCSLYQETEDCCLIFTIIYNWVEFPYSSILLRHQKIFYRPPSMTCADHAFQKVLITAKDTAIQSIQLICYNLTNSSCENVKRHLPLCVPDVENIYYSNINCHPWNYVSTNHKLSSLWSQ